MRTITCHCGEEIKNNLPLEVDLDKNPEIYTQIIEGNFHTLTCPQCHLILKPELGFKLSKRSANMKLLFIPEIDRQKFLLGKLAAKTAGFSRVVIGYPELVEKLKIIVDFKLDDEVIEILKYYILAKLFNGNVDDENFTETDEEIRVYFQKLESDELYFYVEGLKKDELAVIKSNIKKYRETSDALEEKKLQAPFNEFLIQPYVSINNLFKGGIDD